MPCESWILCWWVGPVEVIEDKEKVAVARRFRWILGGPGVAGRAGTRTGPRAAGGVGAGLHVGEVDAGLHVGRETTPTKAPSQLATVPRMTFVSGPPPRL